MSRRSLLRTVATASFGLVMLLCGLILPNSAGAQDPWSFAAISDIHSEFRSFQNVLHEIRKPSVAQEGRTGIVDFVIVLGDLSPVSINYGIFQKTFQKQAPAFFPVRGNHENSEDLFFIDRVIFPDLESSKRRVSRFGRPGFSYYIDWKNTRLIMLDQYVDFKKSRADSRAIQWLDQTIGSANSADHVFVGFHEPCFPWEIEQDPFWRILLKYRPRIRALLFGHTHIHYRARFPVSPEGIPTINVGNGGRNTHSDNRQTIVNVTIDGPRSWVKTVQTPNGKTEFRLSDQFELTER